MQFSGIKKVSLIDYPNQIAATLFTSGCNLRCPFCHNPELVNTSNSKKNSQSPESTSNRKFSDKKLLKFLKTRKNKLDGVVVTGGEPLIHHRELISLFEEIHKMGFLIKLDTNGTFPPPLSEMIDKKLVDFIALDYKTSQANYRKMKPQIENVVTKVKDSLDIIKKSNVKYEIRTTVVPNIHSIEEIKKIAKDLEGIDKYVIQNFVPTQTLDPSYQKLPSFSQKELKELKKICEKYIENVEIRDNLH
jgi:pyruvate formate lyase activating enzyme